jgi:hypothetical protein
MSEKVVSRREPRLLPASVARLRILLSAAYRQERAALSVPVPTDTLSSPELPDETQEHPPLFRGKVNLHVPKRCGLAVVSASGR